MTEYLVVKVESPSGIGDEVLCKTTAYAELKKKISLYTRLGYKLRIFSRPVHDWEEIKSEALRDTF